jgi:hypothetical protein
MSFFSPKRLKGFLKLTFLHLILPNLTEQNLT